MIFLILATSFGNPSFAGNPVSLGVVFHPTSSGKWKSSSSCAEAHGMGYWQSPQNLTPEMQAIMQCQQECQQATFRLGKEVEELARKVRQAEEKFPRMQRLLEERKKQIEEKERFITELQCALKIEKSEASANGASLSREITQKEQRIEELKYEIKSIIIDFEKEIKNRDETISDLNKGHKVQSDLQACVKDLKARLEESLTNGKDLTRKVAQMELEQRTFEGNALRQQTDLTITIKTKDAEIARLNEEIAQLQARIREEYDRSNRDDNDYIKSLKNTIEYQKGIIEALQK
jgi:hypothetical protein